VNELTVERVAKHAGASKGLVHHYFESKNDLIEQMVRYAHALFGKAAVARLKQACSPSERLWSVIDANFAPEIFQPKLCGAWLSAFEAGKNNPRLARICEIADKRTTAHVVMPLRQLVPAAKVESIAFSLHALIDGCWCLAPAEPEMTRKAALSVIVEFLRTHVPRFDMSAAKLDD
jgi:TetR/AcrR family transcriptional repressor of bet genes